MTTPWRRALGQLLADGEWHDLDDCCAAAGPLIPPGRALRVNEANRASHAPGSRSRPAGVEARVASGRRTILRQTLRMMVRHGSALTDPGPPRRWKQPNRG